MSKHFRILPFAFGLLLGHVAVKAWVLSGEVDSLRSRVEALERASEEPSHAPRSTWLGSPGATPSHAGGSHSRGGVVR